LDVQKFQGKVKDRHLQGPEEILTVSQELWNNITLRSFKWHLNHGAIGCAGSLKMTQGTFVNERFTIRPFYRQEKIGVLSHYVSATLY
jgi:hypothetical protein